MRAGWLVITAWATARLPTVFAMRRAGRDDAGVALVARLHSECAFAGLRWLWASGGLPQHVHRQGVWEGGAVLQVDGALEWA